MTLSQNLAKRNKPTSLDAIIGFMMAVIKVYGTQARLIDAATDYLLVYRVYL